MLQTTHALKHVSQSPYQIPKKRWTSFTQRGKCSIIRILIAPEKLVSDLSKMNVFTSGRDRTTSEPGTLQLVEPRKRRRRTRFGIAAGHAASSFPPETCPCVRGISKCTCTGDGIPRFPLINRTDAAGNVRNVQEQDDSRGEFIIRRVPCCPSGFIDD